MKAQISPEEKLHQQQHQQQRQRRRPSSSKQDPSTPVGDAQPPRLESAAPIAAATWTSSPTSSASSPPKPLPAPPSPPRSGGGTATMNNAGPNSASTSRQNSHNASLLLSNTLKSLPPLFLYMETGDFARAAERAKRHPREAKAWATIQVKSSSAAIGNNGRGNNNGGTMTSKTKRLALHQACFKLRQASSIPGNNSVDPFIEVCRFILLLVELYPDAAGMRETRHGCLPLHLAAFASCMQPSSSATSPSSAAAVGAAAASSGGGDMQLPTAPSSSPSSFSTVSMSSALPEHAPVSGTEAVTAAAAASSTLDRPTAISHRSQSESTAGTIQTTMSAAMAEEKLTGKQTDFQQSRQRTNLSMSSNGTYGHGQSARYRQQHQRQHTQSVSMGSNIFISEKREEWAVRVLNALLDAYPRAIRMDSEGGRFPLHTAAAGRATPRVMATLVTAYPAAARQRNKDGFLPLHLSAHWGISHPNVVVTLLKAYPDATFGRNRWERTPLEEALCMAGENGRPHQAALVRALRKHPSYWTRPDGVLFQASSPREGCQIVDVDETLASSVDDSMEGEELFLDHGAGGGRSRRSPGAAAAGGTRQALGVESEGVEAMSPVVNDLPTLIRGQGWEAVLQRLKMYPMDSKLNLIVPTKGGFTATTDFSPLHYACERRPPVEVIKALLRPCPEAASKRTMPGGALPLHIACTWYSDVKVVEALLAADRNACKTQDELGNLPLHSACFSGTSTAVIESLLRAFPKAVLARNNQGSLPEDIAKRLKHDNRVTTLGLLNLCREDVVAKRQQKHRRGRSDGYVPTAKVLNERYEIENFDPSSAGVEVAYDGDGGNAEQELMWV